MTSYSPISKGLNASLPSLPSHIPKRQLCGCQQRNSSVTLVAHFKAEEKSLHSGIETSQRQLGSRAPQESGGHWEVPTGGFQASPGDVNTQEHSGRGAMNLKCVWRAGGSAGIHADFPRLSTAANGRCLIKAFAISLACSVIPFCKQI